ncbi:pentapeptide repeat-containing protein [Curtobacterium sp. 9128]|uniref:pentapeptide repeat-containing protein n=1 Tax=Curtobacterium sp. 9128 TaxID=1793722 RepID=UPI0011A7EE65|nr:pentapeptide repeat-containing protein [Curtobacterium sp. 9128]
MTSPNEPSSLTEPSCPADPRHALRPACRDCFALCCTALGFERSADFPVDKAAGTPCPNLDDDFSCTIHASLRGRGYRGCTVFDCFGAGQFVAQEVFTGVSWRARPATRSGMFAVFDVTKQLHEFRWYLVEARERTFDPDSAASAARLERRIVDGLGRSADEILELDVRALHAEVRALLVDVSAEVRGGYGAPVDVDLRPGADLAGRDLSARRLCGAELRGASLIGADLRGSDLSGVDLLGADLRDARLESADLGRAVFLTQGQVNAARGDAVTAVPRHLGVPAHWLDSSSR